MSFSTSQYTIDLNAVAANWCKLSSYAGSAECAAVVKADAYGLGLEAVAQKLYLQGCRHFFVANILEAEQLALILPAGSVRIYILTGIRSGEELRCQQAGLIPVLNSLAMLRRWLASCGPTPKPAALKVDTGMGRLGLGVQELAELVAEPGLLKAAGIEWVISHLACADEPEHPQNALQLKRFNDIRQQLLSLAPSLKFSLANSAGALLGSAYHFDLIRPGIALYGSNAFIDSDLHFSPVLELRLKVLQLRRIEEACYLGYGASYQASPGQLVAVTQGGYADGLFRSLESAAQAWVGNKPSALLGRVSMDSCLFDVTNCAEAFTCAEHEWPALMLVGEQQSIDDLAKAAGTIAYELLTSLGERFARKYLDDEEIV
ncbi:alanine racemase [Agaribacterium sp. ZY112]|uniref:alanine racemase n=1 Tax=Agaribacterium sp. ZY112 TaxID=3233574 RepID=UPI0035238854